MKLFQKDTNLLNGVISPGWNPYGPCVGTVSPAHVSDCLMTAAPLTALEFSPAEPARPPESGRTRPSVRIRPNSDWGRPSESGRTQIWDGRPNPAELRLGTTARIRPKNTFV